MAYAYGRSEPVKQARAAATLDELVQRNAGVLSTQVVAEFFVTVTRKLSLPLTVSQAYESLKNYLYAWPVAEMSPMIVLEAARGVRDHQFNFWDAQVWAAARLNNCQMVFSEDFNHGAAIEGVLFINPFAPEFILTDWV